MNEIVIFENKRPKLRKAQLVLYKLIVDALEKNYSITDDKLKEVYVSNFTDKIWDNYLKKENDVWIGGYREMNHWELTSKSNTWLRYNIGALIIKGYCVMLPKFKISDIDPKAIII